MDFAEDPKLFIYEYYKDKQNRIDLECEEMILGINNEMEIQSLHDIRMNLIDRIELAKQTVLERFDALESKYIHDMMRRNTKKIKDEIFLDQYCFKLEIYQDFPLFDLKFGLLLFSEFDDDSLKDLK